MLYCNSYLPEPLRSVNTPAQPPYSWIMQPAFRGGRPERMHLAHGHELGFHLACGGTNKSRPADGYDGDGSIWDRTIFCVDRCGFFHIHLQ